MGVQSKLKCKARIREFGWQGLPNRHNPIRPAIIYLSIFYIRIYLATSTLLFVFNRRNILPVRVVSSGATTPVLK